MVLDQLDIHMQRNEFRFRLYTFINFNSKWIKELNVKCKIIKFLEYNIFLGEKAGLKLNIQKTKIMASNPITSWQIERGKVEAVTDFIFWAPKSLQMVTAARKVKDACYLEGKLWKT